MLAMSLPSGGRSLDDMKGDAQARCMDFFGAYALDLPPPLDDEMRAIASAIFTAFKRARLGAMFLVSPGDVEEAIAGVTSDPRGWRIAIESQAGFTFQGGSVPPSAALAKAVAPAVQQRETKVEKRRRLGTSTVSDDLLAEGDIPDDPLDEACFSVFTTDIINCEAIEEEVDLFKARVLQQFASSHFKTNLGAPLLRNIAAQAHRRIRKLKRKGKVDGSARDFHTMIYDTTTNRNYKSYSAPLALHLSDMSDVAKARSADGSCQLPGFGAVDIVTEKKLFPTESFEALTNSSASAVAPEAAAAVPVTAADVASALMTMHASAAGQRSGAPVPVLMAADGSQVPLSSLAASSAAPMAVARAARPEPDELPAKNAKRVRKQAPKPKPPPKQAPSQENVAKNPVRKKASRGGAAPRVSSKVTELSGDESDNDREEVVPLKRSRAPPPPSKPAVVKRPDGFTRTELRKAGDDSSTGNSVIVFEGDTLDVLEEAGCFCRVASGRKIGWINSAYLVM